MRQATLYVGDMRARKPLGLTAFRLSDEMLRRLDRHAARLRRQHPGVEFTRADALREIVGRGLDEAEAAERAARKG